MFNFQPFRLLGGGYGKTSDVKFLKGLTIYMDTSESLTKKIFKLNF